jgi:hypothetical protein
MLPGEMGHLDGSASFTVCSLALTPLYDDTGTSYTYIRIIHWWLFNSIFCTYIVSYFTHWITSLLLNLTVQFLFYWSAFCVPFYFPSECMTPDARTTAPPPPPPMPPRYDAGFGARSIPRRWASAHLAAAPRSPAHPQERITTTSSDPYQSGHQIRGPLHSPPASHRSLRRRTT